MTERVQVQCHASGFAKIFEALDEGLQILRDHMEGKEGGVYSFFEPELEKPNRPAVQALVGYVPSGKVTEKYRYSTEKGVRLLANPDHQTSRESRDEARDQWTGSVRDSMGGIDSFSGAPERVDEALMLYVQVRTGRRSLDSAVAIAETNPEDIFVSVCAPNLIAYA